MPRSSQIGKIAKEIQKKETAEMKAKKIVTVLLTAIVFLSAAFLGVSAVYRVEEVTLVTQNVSAPAEQE